MTSVEDIKAHRLGELEAEFVDRYPAASSGVVYEFDDAGEAEIARLMLLGSAMLAGRDARVVSMPWQNRHRVIASG